MEPMGTDGRRTLWNSVTLIILQYPSLSSFGPIRFLLPISTPCCVGVGGLVSHTDRGRTGGGEGENEEGEGALEDKFAFSFVSSPADSLNYSFSNINITCHHDHRC